jgi:hypothetical protein
MSYTAKISFEKELKFLGREVKSFWQRRRQKFSFRLQYANRLKNFLEKGNKKQANQDSAEREVFEIILVRFEKERNIFRKAVNNELFLQKC